MSSFSFSFPLFCIILSLICSAVSAILRSRAARVLSLCLCLTVSLLSFALCTECVRIGGRVDFWMGHYPHPWGNELRFGPLEPFLAGMFSLIMLLSVLGGKQQLLRDLPQNKQNYYYVMTDLILVSILALCYSNDLFTGFVFIEICTISSCGILMIREIGRTTLASVRYMIFSLIGSGLFLLGVILLYGITGHLLMPNLLGSVKALWVSGHYRLPLLSSAALITIGLGVKSGLFPFHYWMPDTYGAATASSSAILSGLVSKGYIFFLIKIVFRVFGVDVFYASGIENILFVLGLAGMVAGSVSAMREENIFRMIAFSSAAQIGYIYMGIGISPELGITACLFHMLAHAVTKPMLFLSAAQLQTLTGKRTLKELRGSARQSPLAGAVFIVGALSMIGFPVTMGFVCKYYFAKAAFAASAVRMIPALIILAVSTCLNAVYFGRTIISILTPGKNAGSRQARAKSNIPFAVSGIMLSVLNLLWGLNPKLLYNLIDLGRKLL